jgi:hypothetical protein
VAIWSRFFKNLDVGLIKGKLFSESFH